MRTEHADLSIDYTPENYCYRSRWIQLIRPLTLTGTISPILVGTGFAFLQGSIRVDLFIGLLLSALLVQSATNVLNDYYDFKYGQDKEKWVNREEEHAHGISHYKLPYLAIGLFAAAIVIGLWLAISSTWWIVVAGVLGIMAGIKYSAGSHSFSSIGMGEVVAGLFLGPVVTILAYLVQTNTVDFHVLIVSLTFAALIASMILTNNIRDLKKDIGFRKTLAGRLGRLKAVHLLRALLMLPYLIVISLSLYGVLPLSALIVIVAFPVARKLLWSFRENASRADEIGGMKWAARHHWTFGLLFAIGLWLF